MLPCSINVTQLRISVSRILSLPSNQLLFAFDKDVCIKYMCNNTSQFPGKYFQHELSQASMFNGVFPIINPIDC